MSGLHPLLWLILLMVMSLTSLGEFTSRPTAMMTIHQNNILRYKYWLLVALVPQTAFHGFSHRKFVV